MAKQKKANQKKSLWLIPVLLVVVLAVLLWVVFGGESGTGAGGQAETPPQSAPSQLQSIPTLAPQETMDPLELGKGLKILDIGSYAGMYLEDGSDEVVSDVQMILLENTSGLDLQLARITLDFGSHLAEFEATNLPDGASAVLLEKGRTPAADRKYSGAILQNVVFFQEPMALSEDLQITGGNGYLEVENCSGGEIAGDIYIYYKNVVDGVYYGGITYRARVEGGLSVGETVRVVTGHYTQDSCEILMVTHGS